MTFDDTWSISLDYSTERASYTEPSLYDTANKRASEHSLRAVDLIARRKDDSTCRPRHLHDVVVRLEAYLGTTHYKSDADPPGEWTREPWELERIDRLIIEPVGGGAVTTQHLAALRLGSIHDSLRIFLRSLAFANPGSIAAGRSAVPSPGSAGHPNIYYARWTEKYIAAREGGRGYMTRLCAENPTFSESGINLILNRAEELGLLFREPFVRGKWRDATMTDKCKRVIAEAASQVLGP